ncbi:SH3 domain-containing protein [Marinirhabdus gelatinilytica]|uniref:SH3 domain-containing protein n=1 Tax=Marinirhabdus gelatinilytica TaxID=1703343 RepID=A0A370QJ58_9FLAO|nr:SH3 domain-containing protein [Marinirhabdus gelatinilytica]RDK88398.1 hypothetical protein C8D94_101269 [Marinirhabdus gelatinilytica]
MKKVAITVIALTIATVFTACKNENTETETETTTQDLAVADTTPVSETAYLYVTAPSGLTLREFDNLNSDKLAVMPYGTKLKVLTPEKDNTMTVGGIAGGMHQVEYNNKTGFAFNGFLSRFFPPERNTNAKMYVEDLKATFPNASYAETTGGTASNPSNTETVLLPTDQWHEAFYIAQKLYDIPMAFNFPNPRGKNEETLHNPNKPEQLWESLLQIERKDHQLQKITYSQAAEGYGSGVTITQEGELMKIEYRTVAD